MEVVLSRSLGLPLICDSMLPDLAARPSNVADATGDRTLVVEAARPLQ